MCPPADLKKMDLTTFFLSISSTVYMRLGMFDAPSEPSQLDFDLARQSIDLLELLQEKTQGNRTSEEDHLLQQLLFETRMKFIEKERELKPK
jgi:hypothetical protein